MFRSCGVYGFDATSTSPVMMMMIAGTRRGTSPARTLVRLCFICNVSIFDIGWCAKYSLRKTASARGA